MLQIEPITRLKFSQQIPLYGKPLVYRSKQYTVNQAFFEPKNIQL